VVALSLPACQSKLSPPPRAEATNPPLEIATVTDARARSVLLRRQLAHLSQTARQEESAQGRASREVFGLLRTHKREYFALRETLFRIALLRAAAIVERPEGQDLRYLLLRMSLALSAAIDLVENFHAVAQTLSGQPPLREVWNEADPAHGIPAGSWEISLQAYHNVHYQDLFKDAIERLKSYRRQVEGYLEAGDTEFLAVYPEGIARALEGAEQGYALVRAGLAEEDLGQDEKEVRALVERSKTLRSVWAASAAALRAAIAREGGLIRGNVQVQIHTTKREYLQVREGLYQLAFKHIAKLTRDDIPYPRGFRRRAIGISLLAAVTLYENAHQANRHLLGIPDVRALLNQGDPALGIRPGFWDNVEREFARIEYRDLLEAGLQVMEREQHLPREPSPEEDPFLTFVSREISASAAVPEIRGERFDERLARVLRYHVRRVTAGGAGVPKEGLLQLSKAFVHVMGMFEFRKGKLLDQARWVRFVKERLQPGDLLLERSPFRFYTTFVPGHFGHVGLYVGTEADLRDLGLLKDASVRRHVRRVAKGGTIVDALREGVQLSTVEEFLNIDDLAILRPKRDKIPRADVVRAIGLAFLHVGKKYDFRFDNNTWDAIVCSELAFHTYVNVRWTFARILGSYTIAPDDVAIFAGSDPARPFDLITFVHDGRVVHDRSAGLENEEIYVQLLGKRYAQAMAARSSQD
jgi:hypothetical protein